MLGVPFYGRSWAGVSGGDGLYQSASGAGPGTWEPGVLDWEDLAANYIGAPGWVRYWDDEANVPFLFNATTGQFISYDDARSIRAKRDYAVTTGLGGIMIWEMSADDGALIAQTQ